MRLLSLLIFLVSIAACNSKTPLVDHLLNARDTTIILKDSLGSLKISFPDRYDTFMRWTQYSDCGSCGTERYRFQSRKMPIFLESGFFWDHLKDSVDQLTVIHQQRLQYRDSSNRDFIKTYHKAFIEDAKVELWVPNNSTVFDTLQMVSGKWTSLITFEHYDSLSHLYFKGVAGAMLVKGKPIKILFSLLTKRKDLINVEFIGRSKKMMMRIFAENGI